MDPTRGQLCGSLEIGVQGSRLVNPWRRRRPGHVDVLQADVDAHARLAVPEEVRQLLAVGRVVGRLEPVLQSYSPAGANEQAVGGLELARRVQVFDEHVRRRLDRRL